MNPFRTAVAAVVAAATFVPTAPANAATPPPAWTCAATIGGVRVNHDPLGLAATASVAEFGAVVTCRLDGLLTTPPASYVPLYKGDITPYLSVNGAPTVCAMTAPPGTLWPSVGPTLVMAITATCVLPVSSPRTAVVRPGAWWATSNLDGTGYTVHGAEGSFVTV